MRVLLPALCFLLFAACTMTSPGPETTEGSPARVSAEFYLVYEAPGGNVVERTVEATSETVFLSSRPDLTERDISWATMQTDRLSGRPAVLIHFTPIGTDKLALLTRQNIGRRLAIVIDGKILSTPLIRAEIRDGRATIEGFKSAAEAQRVADALAGRSKKQGARG